MHKKINREGFAINKLLKFLKEEDGVIFEYILKVTIIALGSTSILFGILVALRQKGGTIIDAITTVSF